MATIDHLRNKIYTLKELKLQLERWRLRSKKIAFTNGCFDILHLGHVDYLAKASDLADVLIIGLNTDASTRRLKGQHRPINDEQQRAMLLAAMTFVDGVVLFDEETPYELINFIRPDVLVKGADYSPEKIVGYDIVTKNGGMVTTIDFLPGYSTSAIEAKIRDQR